MAKDQMRIEPRFVGASYGAGATVEQVRTLMERRAQHEKITRPPPQSPFAECLQASYSSAVEQATHTATSPLPFMSTADAAPTRPAATPPTAQAAMSADSGTAQQAPKSATKSVVGGRRLPTSRLRPTALGPVKIRG